jgi:DNA-binding transcriptional ArsR family regulator
MTADVDNIWRALADPNRRGILDALAERPLTTGEIAARFDHLCRTAVMKHLDVLVDAGLVVVRREGRQRWNYLNPVPIQRICDRWISRHVKNMAAAMVRLKEVVEQRYRHEENQLTSKGAST